MNAQSLRAELDAPAEEDVLDVRGLTVMYGRRVGLEGATFSVHRGEQMAVVGPNGAGKSTLFKAVAGILEPAAGSIRVHGHHPGVDVCVAYVQQRSVVDWSFPVSVEDVVMMGRAGSIGLLRRPGRADHEAVRQAIGVVDMEALATRQIGELSGGEQQRMFLARALAQEAELVLMDEPLSGLDVNSRREVLAVLNRLEESGVSVMVATHDLELAAEHFDRVMLLNRRLIAVGSPEHVFTEANLREAYRGTIRLVETENGRVVLGDTCCGEEHHHQGEPGGHRESRRASEVDG